MNLNEIFQNIFKDEDGVKVTSMQQPTQEEVDVYASLDEVIKLKVKNNELYMVNSFTLAEDIFEGNRRKVRTKMK